MARHQEHWITALCLSPSDQPPIDVCRASRHTFRVPDSALTISRTESRGATGWTLSYCLWTVSYSMSWRLESSPVHHFKITQDQFLTRSLNSENARRCFTGVAGALFARR